MIFVYVNVKNMYVIANLCTKLEVASITRSVRYGRESQNLKEGRDPDHAPFGVILSSGGQYHYLLMSRYLPHLKIGRGS